MIELTKVQFIVSGHGATQTVEKKALTPVWVNPAVICHFEQQEKRIGKETRPLTRLAWSSGRLGDHIAVQETPEEIMNKIRLARATS